jgi:hypothetical protein
VIACHIRVSEYRLTACAHEAEFEGRPGIGGNATKGRQIGDDCVSLDHHLLVHRVYRCGPLALRVRVRDFQIAG